MKTITEFNKQNLKELRAEIDKALEPIRQKFQIKIGVGNISFNQNQFIAKLTAATGGVGTRNDVEKVRFAEEYKKFHSLLSLPDDLLNKQFKDNTTVYTFIGLNMRASKMPVMLQKSDGKITRCTESYFKKMIMFTAESKRTVIKSRKNPK